MVYLRRILTTTDLSEFSLAAMEYATSFGLLYASKLYLLHVVDTTSVFLSLAPRDPDARGHRQRAEEAARKALEAFVARNVSPDVKMDLVVRTGNPADVIRQFAREEGMDLIVMATHGRTGLRHIVMGSVAEKVVRLSGVPVLAIKPKPVRENILKNEDIESELHLR